MEQITSTVPEGLRYSGMHAFDESTTWLGGVATAPVGFVQPLTRLAMGKGDHTELLIDGATLQSYVRRHGR
jgi:hypothetical protein